MEENTWIKMANSRDSIRGRAPGNIVAQLRRWFCLAGLITSLIGNVFLKEDHYQHM